jgi:hypothetical protein
MNDPTEQAGLVDVNPRVTTSRQYHVQEVKSMSATSVMMMAKAKPRPGARKGGPARDDGAQKKTPGPSRDGDEAGVPEVVARFQDRLREILRHRGMSRRTLAKELAKLVPESAVQGMSQASVGRWFDDPSGPRLVHLGLLAEYFRTTIDALLDPAVPVEELSSAGGRTATLTEDEEEILRLARRMGPEAAMDRLLVTRSGAPTYDQVKALVDDMLRKNKT